MALAHADILFFDVFGTCVDWLSTVTDELRATMKSSVHPDESIQAKFLSRDWQSFAKSWRKGYDMETRRLAQSGNPDKITVDEMHLNILRALVSEIPHLNEAWDELVLERLNTVWHSLRPWDDTVAGLTELSRQFKVGTLTNGNLSLMVDMAKHGGLEWDFILTADLLGSFKPDPQMFLRVMELLDIDSKVHSHRAVMVAAHLDDLLHAKKHGMNTVFVKRLSEDQLDGQIQPEYVDLVKISNTWRKSPVGCPWHESSSCTRVT
ncbi:unnamed protein product [Sympodiomycopsis kandeliae]